MWLHPIEWLAFQVLKELNAMARSGTLSSFVSEIWKFYSAWYFTDFLTTAKGSQIPWIIHFFPSLLSPWTLDQMAISLKLLSS